MLQNVLSSDLDGHMETLVRLFQTILQNVLSSDLDDHMETFLRLFQTIFQGPVVQSPISANLGLTL